MPQNGKVTSNCNSRSNILDDMPTYGQILQQIDDILNKQAFVPSPHSQAGQQMLGQQGGQQQQQPQSPDGGGGGGGDYGAGGIEGDQSFDQGQVPPGDPSGVDMPDSGGNPAMGAGDPSGGDPSQGAQDPNKAGKGADGRGDAPPTDMDNTTVTLRLRDVLDLVSGGKATQSALKIQDLLNKQQLKNDQMMRQQAMKEQQDQQKQQQQAAMGQQGGMMDSGGIYGNPATGGGQPGGQPGAQQPPGGGMGGM
jgi:hypothetical protein